MKKGLLLLAKGVFTVHEGSMQGSSWVSIMWDKGRVAITDGDGWRLQTPLLRPQNLHPLGVRYDPGRAGALQLLGDVCMTPLPLDRNFLEAAGSTEAKPAHLVRPHHP